eukprot:c14151_g1_i3.p1 GENE.c14151_g1_i3~~c14151_g1_i3.p1  ORF type:complete len:328 (-),score=52.68 c14151_g1_i3:78-1061(-)
MPNLTSLNISENKLIDCVKPIALLPNLKNLKLASCPNLTNLSPLAAASNLVTLILIDLMGVTDHGFQAVVQNKPHLTLFRLACSVATVLDFSGAPSLQRLELASNLQLARITRTDVCANTLTQVSLTGCPRLQTIDALAPLQHLETVELVGQVSAANLAPCCSPRLLTLIVSSAPHVQSIDPIQNLGLVQLSLDWISQVTDFSPIRTLLALRHLSLQGNTITTLNDMASLPVLESLDLRGCSRLNDVSALHTFPSLRSVNLGSCHQLTAGHLAHVLGRCRSLYLVEIYGLTQHYSLLRQVLPDATKLRPDPQRAQLKRSNGRALLRK